MKLAPYVGGYYVFLLGKVECFITSVFYICMKHKERIVWKIRAFKCIDNSHRPPTHGLKLKEIVVEEG